MEKWCARERESLPGSAGPGHTSSVVIFLLVTHGDVSCAVQVFRGRVFRALSVGGKKLDDPHSLKSNEMAECAFLLSGLFCATPLMTARERRLFKRLQEEEVEF